MISNYIKDERTIILTVIPAAVDFSTVEAIKIAREYDPEGKKLQIKIGKRTVGVLTKIDLMDRGTNCISILQNKNKYKLDLGIIAVKNRSVEDYNNNMTLEEARKEEINFFNSNTYQKYKNFCGVDSLSEILSSILKNKIVDELPVIKKDIENRISRIKNDLNDLGEKLPETTFEKTKLVFKEIEEFSTYLKDIIEGSSNLDNIDEELGTFQNKKGNPQNQIKKNYISYSDDMRKSQPVFSSEEYRKEIKSIVDKSRGLELSGFLSFKVFKSIIVGQLKKLIEPSLDLLDDIYIYFEKLFYKLANDQF
jgi:vacuolar protein sorting-associated protein 1